MMQQYICSLPIAPADIIVERDYCTISLRVRPETTTETTDVGLNPADELTTLQAEATMLIRVTFQYRCPMRRGGKPTFDYISHA
jgi:hypothetical protein